MSHSTVEHPSHISYSRSYCAPCILDDSFLRFGCGIEREIRAFVCVCGRVSKLRCLSCLWKIEIAPAKVSGSFCITFFCFRRQIRLWRRQIERKDSKYAKTLVEAWKSLYSKSWRFVAVVSAKKWAMIFTQHSCLQHIPNECEGIPLHRIFFHKFRCVFARSVSVVPFRSVFDIFYFSKLFCAKHSELRPAWLCWAQLTEL